MSGKAKPKRPTKRAGNKNVIVDGNVTGSEIHIGDTIIHSKRPVTDGLVPTILDSERPLPTSLDFYHKAPLAKLAGIFRGGNGMVKVPFTFFMAVLIYAGGIFAFRTIQGTPLPPSMSDLFLHIAPGKHFYYYYPDWNAVAFDFILNPLAVVLSIFYHQTIFGQLSSLIRTGVLDIEEKWNKRLSSKYWLWFALTVPLILGLASSILSWNSRYQYYTSDLLVFRIYVLLLIGLSTFLRTSMLVSLLHAVILLSISNPSIPLDILNLGAKRKYENLGEACLLINFGGLLIFLYAATTIYTSVVKRVPLKSDYLFWEAVIHLVAVCLILIYFNYRQVLVAKYIQGLKDDFAETNLRNETDSTRHQSLSVLLKETPDHPLWDCIRRHWLTLTSILLIALLPVILFTIGRNSN
jgi:hypothetical protein